MISLRSVLFSMFILFVSVLSISSNLIAGEVWSKNGVALDGYDVVSYYSSNNAVKGNKKYSTEYMGSTFYFISENNKGEFKKSPESYIPAYDGYCAFAVGKMSKKVVPDPETFKFHNGKLLFFYNDMYEGQMFNTIVPWNQNEKTLFPTAEQNWQNM